MDPRELASRSLLSLVLLVRSRNRRELRLQKHFCALQICSTSSPPKTKEKRKHPPGLRQDTRSWENRPINCWFFLFLNCFCTFCPRPALLLFSTLSACNILHLPSPWQPHLLSITLPPDARPPSGSTSWSSRAELTFSPASVFT